MGNRAADKRGNAGISAEIAYSLPQLPCTKNAYAFPAERISCYSADLIMRQYMRGKGNNRSFSYRDIKKVYVIVLFEKSTAIFHQFPDSYIHYGKTRFNTGLRLDLLQEYCLIALDVFRKIPYPEDEENEQRAWLSFLTTENLEDAERLIRNYPWLEEIYQEIAMLRRKPEEVLAMWSDALRILDENTMKLYVEELEEKLKNVLEERDSTILEKNSEIKQKDSEIKAKDSEIKTKDSEIKAKDSRIAALEKQLAELLASQNS